MPLAGQEKAETSLDQVEAFLDSGTVTEVKLSPEVARVLALTSIQVEFMQPSPDVMHIIGEALPDTADGEAAVRKIFADARNKLIALEMEHSASVVDESGNASVIVKPFKMERQALDKQIRRELVDLAGLGAAYVRWKGYSEQVLVEAGLSERELWIDDAGGSGPSLGERTEAEGERKLNIGRRDNFLHRYGHFFEDGK